MTLKPFPSWHNVLLNLVLAFLLAIVTPGLIVVFTIYGFIPFRLNGVLFLPFAVLSLIWYGFVIAIMGLRGRDLIWTFDNAAPDFPDLVESFYYYIHRQSSTRYIL